MFVKKWRMLLVAGIVVMAIVAVIPLQVCRDYTFICENTVSRMGYRQWCVGLQSGQWRRESRLEQFMRRQQPSELAHRWTFVSGAGKNLVGWTGLREDGFLRLNVAMHLDWFDSYVDTLDDAGKLELYRVLASGDPNAIKAEEKKIETALIQSWESRPGANSTK